MYTNLNTRHKYDLHMQNANLTKYQGVHYTRIRIFSSLPPTIKILNRGIKLFKPSSQDYFLTNPFYCVNYFTSIKKFKLYGHLNVKLVSVYHDIFYILWFSPYENLRNTYSTLYRVFSFTVTYTFRLISNHHER